MNTTIDTIKKTRTFLIGLLDGVSLEQLNKIPTGFNNNIIWNLGHLVAAQQGLCYIRSGLKTRIEESFFLAYKTDSKPERDVTIAEFETIKKLFIDTLDMLEADLQNNLFTNYSAVTTRYGVEIKNVNDAINFLLFHEGLHCGYIMALKRVVKQ